MKLEVGLSCLLLVCVLGFVTGAFCQTPREIFADEFAGAIGTSFDSSKWTAEIGGGGWGNEELQYYTGAIDNVRHDGNGNLEIRAMPSIADARCWYGMCRFTSARLITKGKFDFKYGRVEARIKVPDGSGVWPAFWMLGKDIDTVGWPHCGEIDIMEFLGKEPKTIYGTIHGLGYSGASGISRSVSLPKNASDAFHTFAVEWSENDIRWFVDGKQFSKLSKKDIPKGSKWAFDRPHFLIINFAVGGKWPGNPSTSTIFPQSMLIDYVRVTPIESRTTSE